MKGNHEINSKKKFFILLFLFLFTEGIITGWSYFNEYSLQKIMGTFFITTIFFGIVIFYILSHNIEWDRFFKIGITYCITLTLVLGFFWLPDFAKPIWIISIIFTFLTSLIGGIYFQVLFLLVSALLFEFSMDIFIFYLIIGIAVSLLVPYMKSKKIIGMCIIIISGVYVSVFSGLILLYEKEFLFSHVKEALLGLLLGILILLIYTFPAAKRGNSYFEEKKLGENLIRITSPDFELMTKMKEKSNRTFEHGQKVGELSEAMAMIIGADTLLSKAGGYYYKAGKLLDKDYSLYGAEIGRKYKLPAEVIRIISEHPGKSVNPSTIESGIVMLADTVVSSFEYINSKNLKIEFDKKKAVEEILKSRIEKGYLDSAGISIKMYESLKSYLIQEGSNL